LLSRNEGIVNCSVQLAVRMSVAIFCVKRKIYFDMSVCQSYHYSVRLNGRTRHQLNRFSWNLILEYFFKIFSAHIFISTFWQVLGVLFIMIVSLRINFRIISFERTYKTHLVFNKVFPKFVPYEIIIIIRTSLISWFFTQWTKVLSASV